MTIEQINPISTLDLENWKSASSLEDSTKKVIIDRIDFILNQLYGTFNSKIKYWYFDGAEEGDVGKLSINSDFVDSLVIKCDGKKPKIIIVDSFGDILECQDSFPSRWLYTDDFLSEVKNGKRLFEKRMR